MKFELDEQQNAEFEEWNKNHMCEQKMYSGAIGGRLTWTFIQTSIGDRVTVTCNCGKQLDLSHVESW